MKTGAAFLLFFVLALGGCGTGPSGHIDSGLAALIPPDTLALAGVHLDKLRATPLYRRLAESRDLPNMDPFFAETGLDLESEAHEVLAATNGISGLIMARGTFHPEKTAAAVSKYQGYTLYQNGGNGVLTFVGDSTALAGPAAAVRSAIDRYRRREGGGSRVLMARVDALPGDAQIWAVSSGWKGFGPEALQKMGNAANLNRLIQSVEGASLSVDFRSGLQATATGDCRSDADAKDLAESIEAFKTLARVAAQHEPDALRAYDGIRITQEGRAVKITVNIPEELAGRLAARWK